MFLQRHRRCCRRYGVSRGLSGHHLRQTEVQNLGVATGGHENICWLNVAMDDSLGMCGIQGIGYVDRQRQDQLDLQRAPSDLMLQRDPVQKLQDYEGLTVLTAYLMDGANVGMVQC